MEDGYLTIIRIDAMDCPTESDLVRKALIGLPGIESLDFDLVQRRLLVKHSLPDPERILNAVTALGMVPVIIDRGAGEEASIPENLDIPSRKHLIATLSLTGILAITAEALAYGTGNETSPWVIGCAVGALAIGGRQTARKGWVALRARAMNINLLMTVAVLGAIAIGEWPEAAMVVWLFGIAEALETMSLDRVRDAIRGLMTLVPDTAMVRQDDGSWCEVAASTVHAGAQVRVRPGERIALDGTVVVGRSTVNQAAITGESMPVTKEPGTPVFAGTLNEYGVLEFEVTSIKGETTVDRIGKAVRTAQAQRAPTQSFVDRFTRIYTPAVLLLALLVALTLPIAFGHPWRSSIYMALVLLVIACPCALVISTPVTVVSGLAAAARRGILIKGGQYLELGDKLKFLAMDKTGTLTQGTPTLTDVISLDSAVSEQHALEIAATLNTLSEHPVAAAIVKGYGQPISKEVSSFEALVGRGVTGRIDGETWYLGNHRLAEQIKVCSPALEEVLGRLEGEAKSAVVLATERGPVAVLAVSDTVRESSREAVQMLIKVGVKPVMLTGDNSKTAQVVAKSLGIDEVYGDLLPEEKLDAIAVLAKSGCVGMVGDGVNDAPALARADIGFAMGEAGTDTAIETADVALMTNDLRKLPEFLAISRRTCRLMRQNIAFSIGVKALFVILTLSGHASLWSAIFADMGASLMVVGNGLRILRS